MQQFETTIASLTKRDEQLTTKRAMAQVALDKAITARQQALLAGDLDDNRALDKLQGEVDTAASTLTGINDALAVLAQNKAEAERHLAAEREWIKRAAAADKLAKQVAAIEAALPGYIAKSREFADALVKIGHFHFESSQIAGFIQNAMGQVEVAANFAFAELKAMPDAIREGRQAIPGEPAPVPIVVSEPTPEMQTIFMLRSAKYRDHDGRERFAGQWEDVTMPAKTAGRALGKGIAVSLTDQRRAQLRGARGGDFNPRASDVVDLDNMDEHNSATDPVPVTSDAPRVAGFQVIDRGGPRIGTISVTRL